MPAEIEVDEEELRRQRKKEKKERKRQQQEVTEQQATADTAEADTTPSTTSTPESEEERLRRKEEKRERKRLRRETAASADPAKPSTITPSPSSPPSSLTSDEAAAYRAKHLIHISDADSAIHPITSFASAGFPSALLSATSTFSQPTPIQSQCWPVLLSHRDCIAIADTGSGKTLGFVLPGLTHLLSLPPLVPPPVARKSNAFTSGASGPFMLILSPTRELAQQTAQVTDTASKGTGLRTVVIYGGVDKRGQRQALDAGVHTVVATPGRLLALLDDGLMSLRGVSFLVLDEADRMLDMGFEPDIRAIMGHIGTGERRRQTLMFSATWPTSVQRLASEFIHRPVHISIGALDLKANTRVRQHVEVLASDRDKQLRLAALLKEHAQARVLVFVLYKKEVDFVAGLVARAGAKCRAVSGDKGQAEREAAIAAFKANQVRALVATDVVGRGLDIEGIDLVINYTFPLTVEDYVHRIGRTGRGGRSGVSVTFFTKSEKHLSGELINVLRQGGEEVPEALMAFGTGVKRKEHGFFGQHFKPLGDDGGEMKKAVKVKFDD